MNRNMNNILILDQHSTIKFTKLLYKYTQCNVEQRDFQSNLNYKGTTYWPLVLVVGFGAWETRSGSSLIFCAHPNI